MANDTHEASQITRVESHCVNYYTGLPNGSLAVDLMGHLAWVYSVCKGSNLCDYSYTVAIATVRQDHKTKSREEERARRPRLG